MADRYVLTRNGVVVYDSDGSGPPPPQPVPAVGLDWPHWRRSPNNPILTGANRYAAEAWWNAGTNVWQLLDGGWVDDNRRRDEIRQQTATQDQFFASAPVTVCPVDSFAPNLYGAVNDPAVAKGPTGAYLMAASLVDQRPNSTFGNWRQTIGLYWSSDGKAWQPYVYGNTRHEIQWSLPWQQADPADPRTNGCQRPSLVYDADLKLWALYAEGKTGGLYGLHRFTSPQKLPGCAPGTWTYTGGALRDVADGCIKRAKDGRGALRYWALYRRVTESNPPWRIWWASSADGVAFTEGGVFLESDGSANEKDGVDNACIAVDDDGLIDAVFYGMNRRRPGKDATFDAHQVGVVVPVLP